MKNCGTHFPMDLSADEDKGWGRGEGKGQSK